MQWLLLHEAGHYVLWHNVKMLFLQLSFITLGFFLLTKYNLPFQPFLLPIILGILFTIIYIQLARRFEYEANYFAISKMDNPKGLANMHQKAKERWRKKGKEKDTLWQRLFNIWLLDMYKDLVRKAA